MNNLSIISKILLAKVHNNVSLKEKVISDVYDVINKKPNIKLILENIWNQKINNKIIQKPNIYFVPAWVINPTFHLNIFNVKNEVLMAGYSFYEHNTIIICETGSDLHDTLLHELLHYISVNNINGCVYPGFDSSDMYTGINEVFTEYFASIFICDKPPFFRSSYQAPYDAMRSLFSLIGNESLFIDYLYGNLDSFKLLLNKYSDLGFDQYIKITNSSYENYDVELINSLRACLNEVINKCKKEVTVF